MGPSLKYVHANVGIFTHFLPLGCFKAIEFRFFLTPLPLEHTYFMDGLYGKSHLVPAFIYLREQTCRI